MQVQKTNGYSYTPAFKAKFENSKQFREVLQYAIDNNCLRTLDSSLRSLSSANKGIIRIFHGTTPDGHIYSNFRMGKRSVINTALEAKSPAEASFDGILEIGMLGRKFRSLVGTSKAECNITPEQIIKSYTSSL